MPTNSPESNISHFRQFSLLDGALWLFLKTHFQVRNCSFKNNFCFFTKVSCSQPNKFSKLIFNRFWGIFCQSVHPESNISHICQFCLLDSALWFFIKICLRVIKSNFKMIFALALGSLPKKLVKSIFNKFWGRLPQWVYPESNINHFRQFSLLDSALWFFVKSRRKVK